MVPRPPRTSLFQIWRNAEPYQKRNAILGTIVIAWAGLLTVSKGAWVCVRGACMCMHCMHAIRMQECGTNVPHACRCMPQACCKRSHFKDH